MDHIGWAAAVWPKVADVSESIKKLPGVTDDELGIIGKVDLTIRKVLEIMGWKVKARVENELVD